MGTQSRYLLIGLVHGVVPRIVFVVAGHQENLAEFLAHRGKEQWVAFVERMPDVPSENKDFIGRGRNVVKEIVDTNKKFQMDITEETKTQRHIIRACRIKIVGSAHDDERVWSVKKKKKMRR